MDPSGHVVGSLETSVAPTLLPDDDCDGSRNIGFDKHEFIVVSKKEFMAHRKLLVLQIAWRDGIAYRLGRGEIREAAWERAAPKWKLIVLG
jgi:hypothetical protein